jgi:hypothetical protein
MDPDEKVLTYRDIDLHMGHVPRERLPQAWPGHATHHVPQFQQQTGKFRFLPALVGDLLLDYLVIVIPLRQIFLITICHAAISTSIRIVG